MKYLSLVALLVVGAAKAQSFSDLELIGEKIEQRPSTDNREVHIRINQFFDTCIYEEKCGVFLKNSYKEFGLIKGTFLSIDRRLRCSSLTKNGMLPIRFNVNGYIIDHAKDYSVKNK